jgi:perosamine synthetase
MISISRPSLGEEELRAVGHVFASGWLGLGAVTRAFEEALEHLVGCGHAIAVNSGTSALHLALRAVGVGPGDEVVVPSITFAASIQAILVSGASPVFCEAHADTILMDVDDVARRITPRTKAVMPVHLGGTPCDMDGLLALAADHRVRVVEDAAHAFGSTYRGRRIGGFGDVTCFSFDPIKNITCGEGGAVALGDDTLAADIRRRRVLGIEAGVVESDGFRYHMPDFCAAVGLSQLAKLDGFLARRRAICRTYDAAFHGLRHVRIRPVDYEATAPHIYVVRIHGGRRADFIDALATAGVATGLHYRPSHLQPHFRRFAVAPLPASEQLGQEIVTLPLHCGLSDQDVATVVDAVAGWDRRR